MILIKECNTKKNSYNKYLVDNDTGEKTLLKTINISSATKKHSKRDYIILYDSQMVPISDAFEFLNYELLIASDNTKYQALSALRLLYSFLELFDLEIRDLTDYDIQNLKYFLRGISPEGSFISIDLDTERINDTINAYLSTLRKYMNFLGIEDSVLLKLAPFPVTVYIPESEVQVSYERYAHNERTNKTKTVPKYISINEYKRVLENIDTNYTLRERCIVRLMFEGGLRIGEILGLTAEDIKVQTFTDKRTNKQFESGVIYFRNRITDKKYQLAKRRKHPSSKREYSTKAYKKDVTKAYISVDLVDMINDYINETHDSFYRNSESSKQLFDKNYEKYTITDIVDPTNNMDDEGYKILDENYYVFINTIGKPINISTWNKIIRKILEECNIKLDKNRKENNLNHRFRHGFAMFLVQYKKISMEDLMRLMRHTSISSTAVYYRPTDDDIAVIKEDFSRTLEELIPIITEGSFS
jgi:integrase